MEAGMACHSIFDEQFLQAQLASVAVKPVHVRRIWKHVLQQRQQDGKAEDGDGIGQAHEVPDLPAAAYPLLRSRFRSLTSRVRSQRTSTDGSTTKLLISLQNGQDVEAVLMRHDASNGTFAGGPRATRAGKGLRSTLCVSSQVGCKMACTFCATGTMGFKGNLTAGEIVEQVVHASRIAPVRNIVFMGMGEPLNNYAAVVQAVKAVTSDAFGLSQHHITISTVGVIPRIMSLASDLPGVNLALSLHACNQELRRQIIPVAGAYPLDKLMAAVASYQTATGNSVLIEYIMIAGINDSELHAHQLGSLLQDRKVVVNLIPYNPVSVTAGYERSSEESLSRFQKVVREQYGLRTTVRQEMGQDIAGACGQLVISKQPKAGAEICGDIEELCSK